MSKKEVSRFLLAVSEGMFASFTNALLFCLFWVGCSVGKKGSYGVANAFEEAIGELEKINYESLKSTFYQLKKKGYIASDATFSKKNQHVVTIKGLRRLQKVFPRYHKYRKWTGELFMVIYDIPESYRIFRDLLRKFLQSLGCCLIQKSVWISAYDPRKPIAEFVESAGMEGTVIVSKFGKEGNIGGVDTATLVQSLFKLDKLNIRYRTFLSTTANKKLLTARDFLAYAAILKDDPQLPSELLPEDWLGDKAYQLIQERIEIGGRMVRKFLRS